MVKCTQDIVEAKKEVDRKVVQTYGGQSAVRFARVKKYHDSKEAYLKMEQILEKEEDRKEMEEKMGKMRVALDKQIASQKEEEDIDELAEMGNLFYK